MSASNVKEEARRIFHAAFHAAIAILIPEKCDTSVWTRSLNVGTDKSGPITRLLFDDFFPSQRSGISV